MNVVMREVFGERTRECYLIRIVGAARLTMIIVEDVWKFRFGWIKQDINDRDFCVKHDVT